MQVCSISCRACHVCCYACVPASMVLVYYRDSEKLGPMSDIRGQYPCVCLQYLAVKIPRDAERLVALGHVTRQLDGVARTCRLVKLERFYEGKDCNFTEN